MCDEFYPYGGRQATGPPVLSDRGVPTLGLAMIMKNEANNLPFSLGPIAGLVDEMLVVDTGSTDQGPEIAAGYGARVVHMAWPNDFSKARNYGLDQMKSDFILWLDADNSIAMGDLSLIRDRLGSGGLVFTATEVVVPQGDRLWQKRVFANSPAARFQGRVHEQLVHPPGWPVIHTQAEIRHWGYADGTEARSKGQRNLQLLVSAPETAAGDFYHLYQTGRTLFNLRYFREAREYLERAIGAGQEPGPGQDANPSLWSHAAILLGQVLSRLGMPGEAEEALSFLVRQRPGYGPARAHLGRLLYEDGRYAECVPQLMRALALGCGDPGWGADPARHGFVAASQLARALERTGDPNGARKAWEEAVRLNPANPEPYVALAESHMAAGNSPRARLLLDEAIRLAPAHRRARTLEASL
ncbi:MAG: tetratricopeptide repeat protein [Deltaproteobacteria bacterium]|jgi:Flp pilus assembly protein TadD|nr:tetratricopeptide repeat protein [Deltaproteobacteria bacterium]